MRAGLLSNNSLVAMEASMDRSCSYWFTPAFCSVLSGFPLHSELQIRCFLYHTLSAWNYPRLVSQYAANTFTWTNILFLAFLLLFVHWTRKRERSTVILLLIVFVASFLHYQITPVWMITVLFVGAFSHFFTSASRR